MRALDGWTSLPLVAAAVAALLIGLRLRAIAFFAALDGPSFGRELEKRLLADEIDAARALAASLRPAWAADVVLRAIDARKDSEPLELLLEDARGERQLAAERGLLAIRALGRIALPLSLAIAMVELGAAFNPSPDRVAATGLAFTRGIFVVSVGIALSIGCQLSYAVLAREAAARLREVQLAIDALLASFRR
jgi:hypothetical protein